MFGLFGYNEGGRENYGDILSSENIEWMGLGYFYWKYYSKYSVTDRIVIYSR